MLRAWVDNSSSDSFPGSAEVGGDFEGGGIGRAVSISLWPEGAEGKKKKKNSLTYVLELAGEIPPTPEEPAAGLVLSVEGEGEAPHVLLDQLPVSYP